MASLHSASGGFFLGLLLKPEEEGIFFLQNVELSVKYMTLQHKRLYSSSNRFITIDQKMMKFIVNIS
jgi:hypothetical protein